VRAVGLVQSTDDIASIVLKTQNGIPVRVRDIGAVRQGPKIRLGQMGKADHSDLSKVVDDPDVSRARLELSRAARHTLKVALDLIGVSAPDRM